MKLAHKILLFAITPLLIGGLIITYKDTYTARQLLLQLKDAEIQNDLTMQENRVRYFFNNSVRDLKLLARQPLLQTGNIPIILDYLRNQYPRYSNRMEGLYWDEVSGQVHSIHGEQFNVSERHYWQTFLRGEFVFPSHLFTPSHNAPPSCSSRLFSRIKNSSVAWRRAFPCRIFFVI